MARFRRSSIRVSRRGIPAQRIRGDRRRSRSHRAPRGGGAEHATSELLFNVACAYAVARDKVAMLHAVEIALAAGASAAEFRRDNDFAPYVSDPELATILARADLPTIPVDLEPHVRPVRPRLDSLVAA